MPQTQSPEAARYAARLARFCEVAGQDFRQMSPKRRESAMLFAMSSAVGTADEEIRGWMSAEGVGWRR